jgi:hypothetical protein
MSRPPRGLEASLPSAREFEGIQDFLRYNQPMFRQGDGNLVNR